MQMKGVFPDWFKLNRNMKIFTKRLSLLLYQLRYRQKMLFKQQGY